MADLVEKTEQIDTIVDLAIPTVEISDGGGTIFIDTSTTTFPNDDYIMESIETDDYRMYTEEYEVERVIAENKISKEYLVKWAGYDELTWVPAEDCSCPHLIAEFLAIPRVDDILAGLKARDAEVESFQCRRGNTRSHIAKTKATVCRDQARDNTTGRFIRTTVPGNSENEDLRSPPDSEWMGIGSNEDQANSKEDRVWGEGTNGTAACIPNPLLHEAERDESNETGGEETTHPSSSYTNSDNPAPEESPAVVKDEMVEEQKQRARLSKRRIQRLLLNAAADKFPCPQRLKSRKDRVQLLSPSSSHQLPHFRRYERKSFPYPVRNQFRKDLGINHFKSLFRLRTSNSRGRFSS